MQLDRQQLCSTTHSSTLTQTRPGPTAAHLRIQQYTPDIVTPHGQHAKPRNAVSSLCLFPSSCVLSLGRRRLFTIHPNPTGTSAFNNALQIPSPRMDNMQNLTGPYLRSASFLPRAFRVFTGVDFSLSILPGSAPASTFTIHLPCWRDK